MGEIRNLADCDRFVVQGIQDRPGHHFEWDEHP